MYRWVCLIVFFLWFISMLMLLNTFKNGESSKETQNSTLFSICMSISNHNHIIISHLLFTVMKYICLLLMCVLRNFLKIHTENLHMIKLFCMNSYKAAFKQQKLLNRVWSGVWNWTEVTTLCILMINYYGSSSNMLLL